MADYYDLVYSAPKNTFYRNNDNFYNLQVLYDTEANAGRPAVIVSGGNVYGGYASGAPNITGGVSSRYATLWAYDGTCVSGFTLKEYGFVYASNNACLQNTTIEERGYVHIRGGGSALDTVVSGVGGWLHVSNGGVAKDTELFAGSVRISAGGVAENIMMNGGVVSVNQGGTASNVFFNSGTIIVSGGGTAILGYNPWGKGADTVSSQAGAVVSQLTKDERDKNVYLGGTGVGLVSRADVMEDKVLDAGTSMLVFNNGTANNTVLSGGVISADSGAKIDGLDVYKTGNQNSKSINFGDGVEASNVNVYNGAYANFSGCEISDINVSYGGSAVFSSGTLVDGGIHSGIGTGAAGESACVRTYDATLKNQTFQKFAYGWISGGQVNDTVIDGGGVTLRSNGTSGASAFNTIMNDGQMTISGGCIASATTVNNGKLYVYSAATASDTVLSAGSMVIAANGYANGINITDGIIYVSGGGYVENLAVEKTTKEITVGTISGGATVSGLTLSDMVDGSILAISGAVSNMTLLADGSASLRYGYISGVTLSGKGAYLYCAFDGATVHDLNLLSGTLYANSGTTVSKAFIDGGALVVRNNVIAEDIVLHKGTLQVSAGIVKDLEVYVGGKIDIKNDATNFITGNLTLNLSGQSNGVKTAIVKNASLATEGVSISVKVDELTAGTFSLVDTAAAATIKLQIGNGDIYDLTAAAGEYIYDLNAGIQYSISADGSLSLKAEAADYSFRNCSNMDCESLAEGGKDINGSDKVISWTNGDFAGASFAATGLGTANGWLMLSTAFSDNSSDKKSKVYGGGAAGNGALGGTVNIKADGASVGNLLGGGAAGTVDNNINIDVVNNTSIKALYGGGHGYVKGDISIGFDGGNVLSQIVGGTVRTTGTADVAGEISISVKSINFTGSNIVGGSYINFTNNAAAASVGSVNVSFAGGTAASANLYGAGYAYNTSAVSAVDETIDYTVKNGVTIDITGGTVGSRLNGKGIFGGVFAAKVEAVVENGVNITLSGTDTVAGNIFGGGWAQQGGVSNVTGGVSITIESGVANVIYGGGAHSTSGGSTTVDSVDITVKGGSAKAIYAGGQTAVLDGEVLKGDIVTGDAAITVTGSFATAANFYGTGWEGVDTVLGKSTLNFADYTGEVTGAIANFDEVILSGDTVATLSGVIDAAALTVDLSGRTDNGIFATIGNNSTVAAIDLKADSNIAAGAGTWDLITTAGTKISDFDLYIGNAADAIDLTVGEALTSGIFAGWGISEVESEGTITYKFGLLA